MFANHGALVKHEHLIEGVNSRLDGMQASLLSAKLPHLGGWTEQRQEIAAEYSRLLLGVRGIRTPGTRARATHVYHLYVVAAQDRDALRRHLSGKEIDTQIHYPTPLPLLPAYDYLGAKPEEFPIASRYGKEILSLPIYPEMTRQMIEYVCEQIAAFYR